MASAEALFTAIYTDEHVPPDLVHALRQRRYRAHRSCRDPGCERRGASRNRRHAGARRQSALEAGATQLDNAAQLAYAAELGLAILTFNIADFTALAQVWAAQGCERAGIILSEQMNKRQLGELLRMTLKLLDTMTADELRSATVYLQQFR